MKAWRRWQDYATMVFGIVVFASPFVFAEASNRHAIVVAYVFGVLLVVAGFVAASTREPRRSLILNAPGIVAVIMFIAALTLGVSGISPDACCQLQVEAKESGVALAAGVMAIATVLVGATLRLSPRG
jgi:hypothetical protein